VTSSSMALALTVTLDVEEGLEAFPTFGLKFEF
jgi:hypothetical protein